MTAIGLLLLLAACGKSAQVPLQSWLLDAMEGPTPVSALIHAATMVTAGVYLITRSNAIFNAAPIALVAVAVVGAVTLLVGAIIGCAKDDIKKVLAGSTMSQIGYMVLAAGLGPAGYALAIFHLLMHGFFKANMFLGAGSVMHGMNDDVNMRHYGGLRSAMPVTFITFTMGYLAIIGIPPFDGFFSKDRIIEAALADNIWLGLVAMLGAGITAFYMTRLMLMTFFGERRWREGVHPHESPPVMTGPMAVLAVLSLIGGGLLFIGNGFISFLEPVVGEEEHELPVPAWTISRSRARARLLGDGHRLRVLRSTPDTGRGAGGRVAGHCGRPQGPLRRRHQRGGRDGARAVPHPVTGLLRQPRCRRCRQRPGRHVRRLLRTDPPMADRIRPVVRPVDVRWRRHRRRRSATGEVVVNSFPWLTTAGRHPADRRGDRRRAAAGATAAGQAGGHCVRARDAGADDPARGGFEPGSAGDEQFQFVEQYEWIPSFGVSYAVGVDGISLVLIALATVLVPVCMLAGWSDVEEGGSRRSVNTYFALILVLETMIIGVFAATDVFLFYVFFEAMLIPMYFLIGSYGGPQRSYAAVKFLLYSLLGGLVMLAAVIGLYVVGGTFLFTDLLGVEISETTERWLFLGFFFAFAIKAPLFPFHTWLPDAAAESTPAGAVLLVGVLDKVGTFGMLRYCLPLFPEATRYFTPTVLTLCVIGILYGALLAIGQTDMKRLIAYTSVSHFGFIALGIFALTNQGQAGSTLYMVNHGFSTAALFLIAGFLITRGKSRLIDDYGGVQKVAPILAGTMLVAGLSSLALPGLSSFVSEFLVLVGTFTRYQVAAVLATVGIVLAAVYILFMYQRMMTGPVKEGNEGIRDFGAREAWVVAPLLAIIVALGFFPAPLLDVITPATERTMEQVGATDPEPPVPVSAEGTAE